jgi:hypothetical protein
MAAEKIPGDRQLTNPKPNGSEPDESRKSELNPLLNPVLEQNLNRWAQVYFTSPPEARDHAVMDLLRELEGNASLEATGGSYSGSGPASASASAATPEKLICPVCELENCPEQRFCGFCATPLRSRQPQPAPVDYTAVETPSVLGLSSLPPADDRDLQFLRDRPFGGEYYKPESAPHRGAYLIVAFIVVLAIAAYLKWPFLRQHLQSVLRPPAAVQPARAGNSQLQPASVAPPATTPPAVPVQPQSPPVVASEQPTQPNVAHNAAATPRAVPASSPQPASPAAHPAPVVKLASDTEASRPDNGTQELQLAQRYLEGERVPRDASVAARYLWKAVAKQNTQADLLLADLYARGDGVSKSCGQARMLLVAASEKGELAAAQKLRRLESGGCR